MNLLKYEMYISFAAIAVGVILYYGFNDENADFFKHGKGVSDQYITIYHKVPYHFGVMVSDMAAIVVLTAVGCLISWVIHLALEPQISAIRRQIEK